MVSRSRPVRIRSVANVLTLILAAGVVGACASPNPTTGRRGFAPFKMSLDEQVQIGTEQAPAMEKEFGGKVPDQQAQDYVVNIGRRLAEATRPDDPRMANLPWEFTLLDSGVVNAFALPGGKVFVSRGLAEKMSNEAQMAAVVGHEIGHVTAEHTSERYEQQIAIVGGSAIAGALLGAVVNSDNRATGAGIGAGAGAALGGVWALSYSRDQEIEADRLGMRYMERLKYNPRGAVQVQEILKAASGGGSSLDIMATHPSSDTRIRALNERIEKYYKDKVNNPEYQFHEERFKQQFLARLATLPPPRQSAARPLMLAPTALAALDLNNPATWCAHCAAAAAHADKDGASASVHSER